MDFRELPKVPRCRFPVWGPSKPRPPVRWCLAPPWEGSVKRSP